MNILEQYYNIPINQRGHIRTRKFTRPRTQISEFFEILNIYITKYNLKIDKKDSERISTYFENISKYIYLEYVKPPHEEKTKIEFQYNNGIENQSTIIIENNHQQVMFKIKNKDFEIIYCKKNIFILLFDSNNNIRELQFFEDKFPIKIYDQETIKFYENILKQCKIGSGNNGNRLVDFYINYQYQYPNIDEAIEPTELIESRKEYSDICNDILPLIQKLRKTKK